MKKIASIFTCVLIVFLLSFGTVASAASVLDPDKTSGSLTLYKYEPKDGKSASNEEDRGEMTPVTGAKFTAYQVMALTNGKFAVTANFSSVDGLQNLIDADGGLTYTSTTEFEKMIPDLQSAANGKVDGDDGKVYPSVETKDANDKGTGEYKFDDMNLGIYLVVETGVPNGYITSSQSFLVSIPEWNNEESEWNYDVAAYPKDTKLTVTKEIVTKDQNGGNIDTDETTQAIGDVIPFKISSTIPNYGMSLSDSTKTLTSTLTDDEFNAILFKFNDTLSKGLTLNESSITVTIPGAGENGVDVTLNSGTTLKTRVNDVVSDGADYTVNVVEVKDDKDQPTGENKLTLNFAWAALDQYQGKEIVITYNAVLNEDAVIGSANTNTVTLNYTSDPKTDSKIDEDDPDDPDNPPTPPSDTTEVYTYGMDLTKLFNNANADGTAIDASGVEFSLKASTKDLWFITTAVESDGNYKNAGTGTYTVYTKDMTKTDTTDGIAPGEGTHVVIDGADYIITQKLNPSKTGSLSVNGLNVGTYTLTEVQSIKGYSKLASDITITVSEERNNDNITGKVVATMEGKPITEYNAANNGIFKLTVNNVSKQFNLPLTGGAGFIIFTVCGGIVMAGAIIVFYQFRKRRMAAK